MRKTFAVPGDEAESGIPALQIEVFTDHPDTEGRDRVGAGTFDDVPDEERGKSTPAMGR